MRCAGVRIADHVRPVGQRRERDIIRLDHRQREAGLRLHDPVHLPPAESETRRRAAAFQPRQPIAETEHHPVADVEERIALFARQRRVDARLIADRDRQHRARFAADVEPRHVIDGMAERVRGQQVDAVPWPHPRARLQRVVPRSGGGEGRSNETERREDTRADPRDRRQDRSRRIHLHEDRQVPAARTDVARLDAPPGANLPLHRRVVLLHDRGREVRTPTDEDEPGGKSGRAGHALKRVGKRRRGHLQRKVHLGQRLKRRRQRAVLEEVALSRQRVVEHAPGAADARASIALRIPHRRDPRRHVVRVSRIRAARDAGIAGIHEPGRRGRERLRLLAGMKRVQVILPLSERLIDLVAHAVAQGDVRDTEFVLSVAGVDP